MSDGKKFVANSNVRVWPNGGDEVDSIIAIIIEEMFAIKRWAGGPLIWAGEGELDIGELRLLRGEGHKSPRGGTRETGGITVILECRVNGTQALILGIKVSRSHRGVDRGVMDLGEKRG